MTALDRIAAALAAPKTHRVVTLYESGDTYAHDCASLSAAENWATGERRKIGRSLINRATGETVLVVSVTIEGIPAMRTTEKLEDAKVYPNHRAMIAAITALMEAGTINGYSIHAQKGGVSAGVRIGEAWAYLAEEA